MGYCGPRGIPLSTFLSWDQHDQDAALAWAGYETQRCQSCGHHPLENLDGVHTHTEICPGCLARSRAGKAAKDTDGAVIHLARGPAGTCEHCRRRLLSEAAANATPTP